MSYYYFGGEVIENERDALCLPPKNTLLRKRQSRETKKKREGKKTKLEIDPGRAD